MILSVDGESRAGGAFLMRVMQEEILGPVLTMCVFDTTEEAIRIVNGTRYGLCAGTYTKSLANAHRMAARLVAGRGVRQSGFGREKGQEAMGNYVRTKNVGLRIVE